MDKCTFIRDGCGFCIAIAYGVDDEPSSTTVKVPSLSNCVYILYLFMRLGICI